MNPDTPPQSIGLQDPRNDLNSRDALLQTITLPVSVFLPGTSAANTANYGHFFVSNRAYRFMGASEVHGTAGTDASAVLLNIEKLVPGTATGGGFGKTLITSLSMKTTANVPQHAVVSVVGADRILRKGDSLALLTGGSFTAVADVAVTVYLQEI